MIQRHTSAAIDNVEVHAQYVDCAPPNVGDYERKTLSAIETGTHDQHEVWHLDGYKVRARSEQVAAVVAVDLARRGIPIVADYFTY